MTHTLIFLNEKGGVGKTTLAVTLAAVLAERGSKVLVIDADPQGHATLALGGKQTNGLYALLTQRQAWNSALQNVGGALFGDSLASGAALALLPGGIGSRKLSEDDTVPILLLGQRIAELNEWFDYIVFDTAPSVSRLHMMSYFSAQENHFVVYPTQAQLYGIEGLVKSLSHLETARLEGAKHQRVAPRALGAVVNMFNGKELIEHQNLGWLRGSYGDGFIFSPIALRTAWKQAAQMSRPINLYDPKSKAAKEAVVFTDEVLRKLGDVVTA